MCRWPRAACRGGPLRNRPRLRSSEGPAAVTSASLQRGSLRPAGRSAAPHGSSGLTAPATLATMFANQRFPKWDCTLKSARTASIAARVSASAAAKKARSTSHHARSGAELNPPMMAGCHDPRIASRMCVRPRAKDEPGIAKEVSQGHPGKQGLENTGILFDDNNDVRLCVLENSRDVETCPKPVDHDAPGTLD